MNIALYKVCQNFDLSHKEKSVLLALTSYPDRNCFEAHPSVAVLAKHTGMGMTSVRVALQSLLEKKLIVPQGNTKGGGHNPTQYLICPENGLPAQHPSSGLEEESAHQILGSSPSDGYSQPITRVMTMGFKAKEGGGKALPDSVSESWQAWLRVNVWDFYMELVEPGPYCFATITRKKMLDARFREAIDSGATPQDAVTHM